MKKFINSKKIKILLLILCGTALLFETPNDPDFGWHYKYGEYLFQNGRLLRENIFSYTYQDYGWISSYWIPQLLIYISHHFLGNTLPTILASAFFSIFLFLLLQKRSKDLFSISLVFLLSILSLKLFSITVRPLYLSTVFLLLLVSILREKNNKSFIPLIFLIWANTHADFLLGLFILGIYCLYDFFTQTAAPIPEVKKIVSPFKNRAYITTYFNSFKEYFSSLFKTKDSIPIIVGSFKTLVLSIVATLVNPYGFKLWSVLIKELNQPFRSFVQEWAPPHNLSFLGILLSVFVSAGLILALKPYKKLSANNSWNSFVVVFFCVLGIKSVYFLRIVIATSIFLILENVDLIRKDISPILQNKFRNIPQPTSLAFLFFLFSLALNVFVNNIFLSMEVKNWAVKNKYPYGAVSYIRDNPINGNMLNEYSWGGYLIWQLPEYKTFIDGRMTAWRDKNSYLMEDYSKIIYKTDKNEGTLNKYLEKYNIKWILNRPDSKLVKYLKENRPKEWQTVFEDEVSVILKNVGGN